MGIVLRGLVLRHEEDGDLIFQVEREVRLQPAAPTERADGVGGGGAPAEGLHEEEIAVVLGREVLPGERACLPRCELG